MKFKRFLCSALAAATALVSSVIMVPTMSVSAANTINFIRGDVDGDGEVGLVDLNWINYFLHGKVSADAECFTKLDVNRDKLIDIQDYKMTLKYCLGQLPLKHEKNIEVYSNVDNSKKYYIGHSYEKSTPDLEYPIDPLPNLFSYSKKSLKKSPSSNGVFYPDNENTNVVHITTNTCSGTGFIIDKHVIVTDAHVVTEIFMNNKFKTDLKFANFVHVDILDENGTNGYNTNKTGYKYKFRYSTIDDDETNGKIKTVHIPLEYKQKTLANPEHKPFNECDFALIYVEEDLSKHGIWSVGCMTNDFKRQNPDIITSGYTEPPKEINMKYGRYYSKGKIDAIYNRTFTTKAHSYHGDSGGPMYYETTFYGEKIKSVVGILNSHLYNININDQNDTTDITGCLGCRITPTVLNFLMNNPKYTWY